MNTELRLIHPLTGSNKHGKIANDLLVSDLVEITACQVFNFRKQCLEHDNYMLHEHILAKQGMERRFSKHIIKVP